MAFYSWGQIRFLLQSSYPGVPVDLLDETINTRYARLLDFYSWKGLEGLAMLETVAAVTAGTVSVTALGTSVTGTATGWTSAIGGRRIRVAGDTTFYTVTYVNSTHLTIDRAYEGTTNALAGYTIFQHKYTLPADAKEVTSIFSPVWGDDLDELSPDLFDQAAGLRTETGDPGAFTVCEDTQDTGVGDALHQVELYPIPIIAQGFPLRYQRAAPGFTGDNTSGAPLPFVSIPCLMNGCKSDLAAYLKDYPASMRYENLFTANLNEMVRIDAARKGPQRLRMADRWTRHRVDRVLRGMRRRILN